MQFMSASGFVRTVGGASSVNYQVRKATEARAEPTAVHSVDRENTRSAECLRGTQAHVKGSERKCVAGELVLLA